MHGTTRIVLLLAALSACQGCLATANPENAPQRVVEDRSVNGWMVPHTALVEITCLGVPRGGGSAVFLGGTKAMTAKHVMEGNEGCLFVLKNQTHQADVVSWVYSGEADLALLELAQPVPGLESIELAHADLGEPITVVGYPVRLSDDIQALTVTHGTLASYAYDNGEDRITAPVYFGNSGGPVFSRKGDLVGIAVAIYVKRFQGNYPLPYDGLALMVPYAYMKALL